jgi:hypothetical protein
MNCPSWIYEICVARTASEFLHSELGLSAISAKYSSGLSEFYEKIDPVFFEDPAEELLRFLSEIQSAENAAEYLEGFTYFKLHFESANVKRKLSSIFGNIEDPTKDYDIHEVKIVKNFKAYVFSLRSNNVSKAPEGWKLEDEESIVPKLASIVIKKADILDMF